MVDSPTTRNRFRKQERGTNVNSWGDNLNEALDCIDQVLDGVEAINLASAASYTLTTTNYSTADEAKNRVLVCSSPAAAGTNLIVPSVEHEYLVVNTDATGSIVPKTAAGTGPTIPPGGRATVYCDGVNVSLGSPNYLNSKLLGLVAGTANTDGVNVAQMAAAIAASVPLGTAGTFFNSVTDTTRGYNTGKNTALSNGGLVYATANGGADESQTGALSFTNLAATTNVASTDRFAVYDATATAMRYQTRALVVGKFGLILQSSGATVNPVVVGNLYPVDCTSGVGSVTFPASASAGDVFGLIKYGTNAMTVNTNSLNYYGAAYAALGVAPEGISLFFYSGASRGWIDA